MAIADRITSIEEHIKESYQELEGIGIDTTGVHKNLENIPKLIDGYWETLPKVTGEGTSITLDNTKEGKMKINLKGNTYQDSTTGKNLIGTNYITGVTINDMTTNDITIRGNWASTIVSNANLLNILEPSTTYTISYKYKVLERPSSFGTNNSVYILGLYDGGSGLTFFGETQKNTIALNTWDTITRTFTTPASLTNYRMIAYDFKDTNNTTTGAIEVSELQIEKGSSATTFEIFTYGASPNPDYPQEVHVVSGDNTINVVGKNLFSSALEEGSYDNVGTKFATNVFYRSADKMAVQPETTYTLSLNGVSQRYVVLFYNSSGTYLSQNTSLTTGTFTTPVNTYYINIRCFQLDFTSDYANLKIQLELGNQATTYEAFKGASYPISLGDIQLLHIPNTNYYDKIDKSSDKNLFDKNAITNNAWLTTSGTEESQKGYCISDYIEVISNEQYRLPKTGTKRLKYYNSNKEVLTNTWDISDGTGVQTITIPNNAKYVRFSINKSEVDINTFMFNIGTTTLEYEPYGTGWYVKKEIGKVVLDGTETGWSNASTADGQLFRKTRITSIANTVPISNYYKGIPNSYGRSNGEFYYNQNIPSLDFMNDNYTTLADYMTWLSTHNTIVYYVLATPTYTLIEDSTLISQLETIKKSYEGQTNITQENNDMPFELNVEALKGDE